MQWIIRLAADGTIVLILLIAAPVVLNAIRKGFWTRFPVLVMAGLTSLVAAKFMSLLYQPAIARPFLAAGVQPGATYIDNPGFPSDHVLLATVTVVAVIMLTKNRKLSGFLVFLVLFMSVGRVLALVHTPLDIIGGMLAGLAGLPWYRKLTK